MRTTPNGIEYGGSASKYYWDLLINANATISNALANCTTYVYGNVKEEGHRAIVSRIVNAGNWHNYLANGWLALPYEYSKVEIGDVLEWQSKNHVARVSEIADGKIYISGSFYTGEHGKSMYNGSYDTRYQFKTLEQLSRFMIENYPERFFHFWNLETENKWVNGTPTYILKQPLYSVARDERKNQLEVLTNEQYVRNQNDEVISGCESGYYNVLSSKEYRGYTWYEVEKNKFIALVKGRVNYLPKTKDDEDIINENKALKKENEELKRRLQEINKLSGGVV